MPIQLSIFKTCTHCKQTKLFVDFCKNRTSDDGRMGWCRSCIGEYYQENRNSVLLKQKERADKDRDSYNARMSQNRRSRIEKDPSARDRENESSRRQYAADPERYRGYKKRWEDKNPSKNKESKSLYEKSHPEARLAIKHRRRAREVGNGGSFTEEDWQEILKEHNYRCRYCGIGGKLEAEHWVPLSRGGTSDKSNIVPACRSCNRKKNSKTGDEFIAWLRSKNA